MLKDILAALLVAAALSAVAPNARACGTELPEPEELIIDVKAI